MKKELFRLEVGVLLPPDHEEFEQYKSYGKKFSFYDEDQSYSFDKEHCIEAGKRYVSQGCEMTYAVVSTCGVVDDENYPPIDKGSKWVECEGFEGYNQEDVIYSRYKIDNDHAVDGFIQDRGS